MSSPFKICDAVHGFIRFNEIIQSVIDSRPFQRLRYIRQMGMAYLVYPGAHHTRFEHSLGVMELATRIYDTLLAPRNRIAKLSLDEEEIQYWREILRLAALCHDFGHLPFSHTAEKALLGTAGHEEMTAKLICLDELKPIWSLLGSSAEQDILKLAVSHSDMIATPWEKMLSQIITEDNFGADRMDYLIRDGYFTGVSYGRFDYHQLIDSLRILPHLGEFHLGVTQSGIQSVESLWISRYMMYMRVYQLPKTRVYSHHMKRFMCRFYQQKGLPKEGERYLEETDHTLLSALLQYAKEGDSDAAVLLKWQPPFSEVHFDRELHEEELAELERQFQDRVMLDFFGQKQAVRDFPVLNEDGEIISSIKASSFLREIPPGGKPLCLFAHPSIINDVRHALRSMDRT